MHKLAKPMLLGAALIWGSSFFIMKGAVDIIPVFFLMAIRFTGAAVILALVYWKKWRDCTKDYFWRGAVMGFILFCAYSIQNFGIQWTTPSNNAFLTAVYCVLVPFLNWAVSRERPDRYHILSAVLCVTGVGLVSLNGGFHMASGDVLTLIGAFFYAAHIVAVHKVSDNRDIYLLTILQFAFAALFSWLGGALFQKLPDASVVNGDLVVQMFYLTVMCTTVALLFQNVGQVWSDPSSAAILLSLESVFGVLFSVIFYGDPVTPKLLAGFSLIFVAVVCSETKLSFLRKKTASQQNEVNAGDNA